MIEDLEMITDLACKELSEVKGGMKWKQGTENDDVIDARGDSYPVGGFIITFDASGHFSGAIV
jgi:hypothetical protein